MAFMWKNGVFLHGHIAANKIGVRFPEKARPTWNEKNVSGQSDIEISLSRWFRTLTILGCSSFYMKNGEILTSIPRFFLPICLIVLNIFLIVYMVYYHVLHNKLSDLERYLLCFEEVTFFMVPTVFYIFMQTSKKNWIILMANLKNVESHLGHVHIDIPYKFIVMLLLPCIIPVAVNASTFVQINLVVGLIELFTILTAASSFTAVNLYGFLLRTIRSHYQLIITKLNKSDVSSINCIMRMSNKLLIACTEVNNIYGPALLISFFGYFVLLTEELYRTGRQIGKTSSGDLILRLAWPYFYIIQTAVIIHSSAETTKKANEFNEALYKMIMADKNDVFSRNYKVNTHLASQKTAVFTASGWFTIDYTTSCSMIATSATYLIILLQMGGTSLGKDPDG